MLKVLLAAKRENQIFLRLAKSTKVNFKQKLDHGCPNVNLSKIHLLIFGISCAECHGKHQEPFTLYIYVCAQELMIIMRTLPIHSVPFELC